MKRKPSRLVALMVGVVMLLGLAPVGTASAGDDARAEHQRIIDFWTKDKVAKAKPRDFVRDPATGEFALTTATSADVLGAAWNDGGTVQKTTGKVLFAMGQTYYVCSASVATDGASDRSIILTAGHCVFDNKTSKFATNWMFVPDYDSNAVALTRDGSFCPNTTYGCWTATALVVHKGFASQRKFNTQATLYDFAFAVVGAGGKGDPQAQLDGTVGSQDISYGAVTLGSDTSLFGYPAASPYNGKDLIYSMGPLGTDPLNKNLTYRVTSDMTGGSSGGPWFTPFSSGTGVGTMISVNSYGYTGVTAMHGPKFNATTGALFTTASTATANTIVS